MWHPSRAYYPTDFDDFGFEMTAGKWSSAHLTPASLAQWPSGKTAKNGLDSKLDHPLQIRPLEVNQQSKMPDFLHTELYLNMFSENIMVGVKLSPSFAVEGGHRWFATPCIFSSNNVLTQLNFDCFDSFKVIYRQSDNNHWKFKGKCAISSTEDTNLFSSPRINILYIFLYIILLLWKVILLSAFTYCFINFGTQPFPYKKRTIQANVMKFHMSKD